MTLLVIVIVAVVMVGAAAYAVRPDSSDARPVPDGTLRRSALALVGITALLIAVASVFALLWLLVPRGKVTPIPAAPSQSTVASVGSHGAG